MITTCRRNMYRSHSTVIYVQNHRDTVCIDPNALYCMYRCQCTVLYVMTLVNCTVCTYPSALNCMYRSQCTELYVQILEHGTVFTVNGALRAKLKRNFPGFPNQTWPRNRVYSGKPGFQETGFRSEFHDFLKFCTQYCV